jgi:hypothetical protein
MNAALALSNGGMMALLNDPDERRRVSLLESCCKEIEDSDRKVATMHRLASEHPGVLSFSALKAAFYRYQEHGLDGLVDRRKVAKPRKAHDWVECYQSYCEKHNRSNRGGWRAMINDLHEGKSLPFGIGDIRECWRREHADKPGADIPQGWYPRAARYESLEREMKRNPHYLFQIVASRQGRQAAHKYLLPVLRTREGLDCGERYEYDDLHLDVEVVMPGIGKIARPQEFCGYDIASGMQIANVMRPQYPDSTDGKRSSLKEKEFRYMHAHVLTNIGFSPKGVCNVVEHGTTAIRDALERKIKSIPIYGSMITYLRSGIQAEAVHAGMFKGSGGGNFRMKAYCEQAHRAIHSMLSSLPGQIGQDAEHRPEAHASLVRYENTIMQAAMSLTEEQREMIIHGLLDWQQFSRVYNLLTDRIYDNPDHRLEGFGDKRMTLFRLSDTQDWLPIGKLDDMAGEQRTAVMAYLRAHPENLQSRQMTRREAWLVGSRNLVRVPLFELPLLLDDSDYRMVTVRKDGTFEFVDQFYYGPDKVIFTAQCEARSGFQTALVPGQEYAFWTTPLHRQGVICDRDSGNVIGVCSQYKRAGYNNQAAIVAAAGAQNHDLATKMLPIRGRHQAEAEQRMAMIGNNADVLAGRIQPKRADLSDDPASLEEFAPERRNQFWDESSQEDDVLSILNETH